MSLLLLADHDETTLSDGTRRVLAAVQPLGQEVDILVAGDAIDGVAGQASRLAGVRAVVRCAAPALRGMLAEPLAALLASLADGYDFIVGTTSVTAKAALPRLAALRDVMPVTDVIAIDAADQFRRPIYAGNAIETVRVRDGLRILTVRPAGFAPAPDGTGAAPMRDVAMPAFGRAATLLAHVGGTGERPDISSAKVVVSGGRALRSAEEFQSVLEPLAVKLDAALGASRAAVDAGYAPGAWQVGQTGKIIAPDLYIACGISGAIQHLAGMKDSKVIVAINKDPDAPIFQVADYGLQGDLFEIVPQLVQSL